MSISELVTRIEERLAPVQVAVRERGGGIFGLMFHTLFADRAEIARGEAHPHQETTLAQIEAILIYFRQCNYRVISPSQLASGVDPKGRYAMLTFDDGYFNNARVLPLLEKYDGHATVFVAADYVLKGRAFWWEALYARRRAQGWQHGRIFAEMSDLNRQRTAEVEEWIKNEFGGFPPPRGDMDRPFTPAELKRFAASPHVTIGNHTVNHTVLGPYSEEEMAREIAEAQRLMRELVGYHPLVIAYPNGCYSPRLLEICQSAGLKLGFSAVERKDYLCRSGQPANPMNLGRFRLDPSRDVGSQLTRFRSDLHLVARYNRARDRVRGGRSAY
jgi:peptidoglycan/xylan/chitin deacetylase (PgdA/CDA1 family)